MQEQAFWTIVESARKAAGTDIDGRVAALAVELDKLSAETIQQFERVYNQMMDRAYRWDLWGAAYLMHNGGSDDSFCYFCDWLISEGQEVFERALANPDSLADVAKKYNLELDSFSLELFASVAFEVFEAKTGGLLQREFSTKPVAPVAPAGEEWEVEDLPRLFPRLAASCRSRWAEGILPFSDNG